MKWSRKELISKMFSGSHIDLFYTSLLQSILLGAIISTTINQLFEKPQMLVL